MDNTTNTNDLRVLIVDDEDGIRKTLAAIASDEGFIVHQAASAEDAEPFLQGSLPEIIFLDVWLPGLDGLGLLKKHPRIGQESTVIMVSGHGTIEMAVQALKLGAADFIEKPLGLDRVLGSLHNAASFAQLRKENARLRLRLGDEDSMVGKSPATAELRTMVRQAAASNVPVFVQGENGTGKELVARTIHRQSPRANKPFIAVNCAAIPETLIESELFGYEKGAFTGASATKKGRFELADKGTLFLDEVLDLSAPAQAKLLRALQEMEFERVGGEKTIRVDVRIIAASNKDVHEEVKAGRFREDLYYRLHVLPVHVSPLRNRAEDIEPLCRHFLALESDNQARPLPDLLPEALSILVHHDWPGNVRQLRNIVQRLLVLCEDEIDPSSVARALGLDRGPIGMQGQTDNNRVASTSDIQHPRIKAIDQFWDDIMSMDLQGAKDTFEERFLLSQLLKHGYNVTHTAQSLGMYPSNLHAKIRKYGFER